MLNENKGSDSFVSGVEEACLIKGYIIMNKTEKGKFKESNLVHKKHPINNHEASHALLCAVRWYLISLKATPIDTKQIPNYRKNIYILFRLFFFGHILFRLKYKKNVWTQI